MVSNKAMACSRVEINPDFAGFRKEGIRAPSGVAQLVLLIGSCDSLSKRVGVTVRADRSRPEPGIAPVPTGNVFVSIKSPVLEIEKKHIFILLLLKNL